MGRLKKEVKDSLVDAFTKEGAEKVEILLKELEDFATKNKLVNYMSGTYAKRKPFPNVDSIGVSFDSMGAYKDKKTIYKPYFGGGLSVSIVDLEKNLPAFDTPEKALKEAERVAKDWVAFLAKYGIK